MEVECQSIMDLWNVSRGSGVYLFLMGFTLPTMAVHDLTHDHIKLHIFDEYLGLKILTFEIVKLQRPQVHFGCPNNGWTSKTGTLDLVLHLVNFSR